MSELYPKIESVFKRDEENNFKTFKIGQWANPAFEYLERNMWEATEKVDGTNMRIHVQSDEAIIGGRNENSEIHPDLMTHCQDIELKAWGNELVGLTLYGEGYGAGVQKGGDYRPDKGFILFDVMVTETGMFLERENVEDIASKLEIPVVPIVWTGKLFLAVNWFLGDRPIPSALMAGKEAEGWVLRPETELLDRQGRRVITKMKVKDFPHRTKR